MVHLGKLEYETRFITIILMNSHLFCLFTGQIIKGILRLHTKTQGKVLQRLYMENGNFSLQGLFGSF